ncbi:MAG: exo-alpha-sialidase [Planctomycetes bacterium]|nr:exo-alpha-sialidase [Planctomycetota bacterium]MBL7044492.1 exo-alpha-sialidase [Pirellulaceae bacterium]
MDEVVKGRNELERSLAGGADADRRSLGLHGEDERRPLPLTGRRGFAVWDSSSSDLVNWTEPVRWTERGTTGYFQEARNGDYWLVTIAGRSGNHDLYIQRSGDKGKTWTDPAAITSDPLEDYLFSFRIASDGTFILLWERHDASVSGGPLGRSTDIYLSTSADGIDWTAPELLTPETGEPKNVDTIPSLLEGPDSQIYAVWLTSRVRLTKPTVVGVPVWPHRDLSDVRRIPAEGYAVCGQTLSDGRYMLAWVAKVSGSKGGHDNFYRILADFNFEGFDPVSHPAAAP